MVIRSIVEQTVKIDTRHRSDVPRCAFNRKEKLLAGGGCMVDYYQHFQESVALAFCEQLLDDLPMDSHDQYIQKIIGEGITYHCV